MFKKFFGSDPLKTQGFCGWLHSHDHVMWWFTLLPKTNIAPENRPSQPVFPPSIFRRKLLVSGRVIYSLNWELSGMIFATFPWKPSNFKGAGAKSVTAEPIIGRRKRIRADQQMTAPCFRVHFAETLRLSDVFLGSCVVVRWSESSFLWVF